jgi:hypothetical protein
MRGKIMPQGTDEDLIMEIDRRLKPTGQASKQYGAFTIYKETSCTVNEIVKEKSFPEPRLVILKGSATCAQGFIVAEGSILFEITEFSVIKGMIALVACYYNLYINYPKVTRATTFLILLQEICLQITL